MKDYKTIFCLQLIITLFFSFFTSFTSIAASPVLKSPIKLLTEIKLQAKPPLNINRTIKRYRLANVDFKLLGGEGRSAKPANQSTMPDSMILNLFTGVNLVVVRDKVEALANGGHSWIGKVRGDALSQVVMVVHNGRTTGDIRTKNGIYQIRPLNGGMHTIYQINEQNFPESKDDTVIPFGNMEGIDSNKQADAIQTSEDDGSTIDVMVAYTPNAAAQTGGVAAMQDLITATIVGTNTAYQNSGISYRLRLVKVYETSGYNSSGSFSTDLNRLQSTNEGYMDEIHGLRDSSGADLVSLWVESNSSCGIGYIRSTASSAFTVIGQNCANGNLSFAHEIGHNMGARHDWYMDNTIDNPTYNHGYINTSARWRTVMSYNNLCADQGFNCTRIAYLSNPNVLNGGLPTGVAGGTSTACSAGNRVNPSCDADNRLIHNNRAFTVANFRESVTTTPILPNPPNSLTVSMTSSSQISLAWIDASNNETGFKIERCQDTSCTDFTEIATVGSNVSTYDNTGLTAGTTYRYRVRATNSAGASAYSNIADATTAATVTKPAAPSSLVTSPASSSQINLTWSDSANNETGFKIERCQSSNCTGFAQIATVGANTTSYANTGLTANTAYRYRVRANNSAGDSAYSNIASAITPAIASLPKAPSSMTAMAISNTQIRLNWRDNANNETSFSVEYCRGSIICTNFAVLGTYPVNVTSVTLSGASTRTYYRFRVRAVNAAGNSAYSNVAMVRTP